MTPQELLDKLGERRALLTGHFRLSSGLHSDRFIQKFRLFEDPTLAEEVGATLAHLLSPYKPEVVVSAAVGGILPGYIVAKNLGVRNMFVEKENGIPTLRRGFELQLGERVAVVEDVMTTGKSTMEVIDVVRASGAQVSVVGTVVNRGKPSLPYPVITVLDLPLADYPPEACPLCKQGVPLHDPGSRRS